MIPRRRQELLYLCALILIVAVNALVLGRIYVNRHGTPESFVELTERELRPSFSDRQENSGLALRIVWRTYSGNDQEYNPWSSYGSPEWFDTEKLRRLGFKVPAGESGQEYRRAQPQPLPKRVFAVLEMNSPLHLQVVAQLEKAVAKARDKLQHDSGSKEFQENLKKAAENLANEKVAGSRLFIIDAGLDPEALRKKYADSSRYLIARAIVRMRGDSLGTSTQVRGWIEQLDVLSIHVAKKYRERHGFFEHSTAGDWTYGKPPRYKATLAYGNNYEPWLVAVNRMQ